MSPRHRVRYRHYRYKWPRRGGRWAHWDVDGEPSLQRLLHRAASIGQAAASRARSVQAVTMCVIERRIEQGGLSAWAEVGRGYAFCSIKDQFSRKRGRQLAEQRAMRVYAASEE